MTDEKKLLGMIGMCRKAGKAVIGTDMVCEYLRKQSEKKVGDTDKVELIVLEGADTSENTHKKIRDKCIYYNVKHIKLASDCEALGKVVGKRATAAVAIADPNFCRAILGKLNES